MNTSISHINFDANASLGPLPGLFAEVERRIRGCLNPSSIHTPGQRSRALIEESRDALRSLIKAPSKSRIIFTSGATEANALALRQAVRVQPWEAVTSAIEHPSVIQTLHEIKSSSGSLKIVLPSHAGVLCPESMLEQMSERTTLVSLMLANNETGALQPVQRLSNLTKSKFPNVLVHSDAVQAIGKISCNFIDLGVDMLSISGHKIGAFPGVGALILAPGLEVTPILFGGPQEGRQRAGTENLPGIVSLGIAAQCAAREFETRVSAWKRQKQFLWNFILEHMPRTVATIQNEGSLPNTLHLMFPGIRADDLVVALDLADIAASTGAACASGKIEPSHVLLAMQRSESQARSSVRISLAPNLEDQQVKIAAEQFVCILRQMDSEAPRAYPAT
jgi:cysteine desulfurase